MIIGEKTIEDIKRRSEGLLRMYLSSIDRVVDEDSKISISMPIEIENKNGIKVKVGIKFVTDKIEDSSTGYVHEEQPELDFNKAVYRWTESDYRTRCHCEWMAEGGEGFIPDFEDYFFEKWEAIQQ